MEESDDKTKEAMGEYYQRRFNAEGMDRNPFPLMRLTYEGLREMRRELAVGIRMIRDGFFSSDQTQSENDAGAHNDR